MERPRDVQQLVPLTGRRLDVKVGSASLLSPYPWPAVSEDDPTWFNGSDAERAYQRIL
ncbi:MAG: hypothetical protein J2P48_02130 [Alphaproteobacteria bacterium]|nr:hypothetical protein [Alphaproteobacteria bacterium]